MNSKIEFNTKVIQKLEELGADKPCHRCGHTKIEFVGYSKQELGDSPDNMDYDMPVAITACQNCAVISYHALIPLGLAPADEE
ncbi:hypothetical protein CWB72_12680 [Pseudoalteromonas phenolica]|uniref:hypothetical protein n=1 Tax=Pseudoalteromonas phenolica TaxID=161398 RepID=UPI00110BD071|nr:hypothetical protein [Pseudoalteromonas phenolica]TMN88593.1 hypothetical protein CWB72_12680 [Pseudoalteromonas phenolica]